MAEYSFDDTYTLPVKEPLAMQTKNVSVYYGKPGNSLTSPGQYGLCRKQDYGFDRSIRFWEVYLSALP